MLSIFSMAQKPVLMIPKVIQITLIKLAISDDDKCSCDRRTMEIMHIWQLSTGK